MACIFLNAFDDTPYIEQWSLALNQCLAAGYILSLEGARILVQLFDNCVHVADHMTKVLQSMGHSYMYYPWLMIQLGKDSTLNNNFNADHQRVLLYLNRINYSIKNYEDQEE